MKTREELKIIGLSILITIGIILFCAGIIFIVINYPTQFYIIIPTIFLFGIVYMGFKDRYQSNKRTIKNNETTS